MFPLELPFFSHFISYTASIPMADGMFSDASADLFIVPYTTLFGDAFNAIYNSSLYYLDPFACDDRDFHFCDTCDVDILYLDSRLHTSANMKLDDRLAAD